ncbi:MAG: type II toxin-antitoxin system VapC family toxin [Agriterribacter sp.]
MASKAFADANMLLDFTLKRAGFQDARDIIQLSFDGVIQLCTTPSVLHIVGYYTAQAYDNKQAKIVISTLLNDVLVIDCNHETSVIAINSKIDDIEDALQYFAAVSHGVDFFISADKKLKKSAIPQLPVYSATEFLAEFGQR